MKDLSCRGDGPGMVLQIKGYINPRWHDRCELFWKEQSVADMIGLGRNSENPKA